MLRLAALVWLVGLVVGKSLVVGKTKYCCMAPQYESDMYVVQAHHTVTSTPPTITTADGMVSVDSTARMIAFSMKLNLGGITTSVRVIQIYNNRTQYTIQENVCRQSNLPAWTPNCVPDDAKLLKTTYYGQPNNKVDVDIYEMVVGDNTAYATVARPDCTVYTQTAYGSHDGSTYSVVTTFGSFTLGIKDSSVFDIPAICHAAVHEPAVHVEYKPFF